MTATLHSRALTFLQNLDRMSATELHDAFINEVIENHGRFDSPSTERSHLWDLSLHRIAASGSNEEEAIANWMRLARKAFPTEEIEDDGFITVHPIREQIAGGAA